MRTTTLLIALMSVMVVVFAGVALAAVIVGNDKDNLLVGTNRADTIKGKGGDDIIRGLKGDDKLYPGSGEDIVNGGQGNVFVDAVDRNQDKIICFGSHDRVRANPGDVVSQHELRCETVIREGPRVRGPFEPFTP